MKHSFDIIIIGGGHAGVEAALIGVKKGCSVLMVTQDLKAIGRMSCNPAIGGLAKGQLVREIDVLGGQMGCFADFSGIRPKLFLHGSSKSEFYINEESDNGFPGFVNLIGIDSPGLTSSLSIANSVNNIILKN